MTTIFLARHGQTADNANRVFQGQGGRGLDDRGRAQARRLAARIAHAGITAVVSSDLERAVETARIASHGLSLELGTDVLLREIDVGTWTGKSYTEIAELYPEEWAAWNAGLDVRRGGGETYGELAVRIDRALVRIADAHPDPNARVLVVSHGGAIRSWVSRVLGLDDTGRRALAGIANTAITTVERLEHGWRLHALNDTAHLEDFVAPTGTAKAASPASEVAD